MLRCALGIIVNISYSNQVMSVCIAYPLYFEIYQIPYQG